MSLLNLLFTQDKHWISNNGYCSNQKTHKETKIQGKISKNEVMCTSHCLSHSLLMFSFCVCRHWLKVSVSLTLVMGITWLAGLLVFRKELISLTYIMTVFIAGQGILLFIILVPLSKQVGHYDIAVHGPSLFSKCYIH